MNFKYPLIFSKINFIQTFYNILFSNEKLEIKRFKRTTISYNLKYSKIENQIYTGGVDAFFSINFL